MIFYKKQEFTNLLFLLRVSTYIYIHVYFFLQKIFLFRNTKINELDKIFMALTKLWVLIRLELLLSFCDEDLDDDMISVNSRNTPIYPLRANQSQFMFVNH